MNEYFTSYYTDLFMICTISSNTAFIHSLIQKSTRIKQQSKAYRKKKNKNYIKTNGLLGLKTNYVVNI